MSIQNEIQPKTFMDIAIHGEEKYFRPSWLSRLIPLRLFQTRFFSAQWNENFVRSADAIPLSGWKLLDYPTPLINLRESNAPSSCPRHFCAEMMSGYQQLPTLSTGLFNWKSYRQVRRIDAWRLIARDPFFIRIHNIRCWLRHST